MDRYIDLGPWLPDIAPHVNAKGLNAVTNAVPSPDGWRAMRALANLGTATALPENSHGSFAGIDSGGVPFLFAGTSTALFQLRDSGMVDISRASGYAIGGQKNWSFAKYGDLIFAAAGRSEMQYFQLGSGGVFADVEGAPRAEHIDVVGDHLVAANIYDPYVGALPYGVSFPAIGNPLYWPDPSSNEAVAVQANRRPLLGNGGAAQDVVSGAEVGAVFLERAIWRMDYRGGREVFEFNEIEKNHGMLIPGSGVSFGRNVFYLAEDGLRVTNYTESTAVGKGRVDRLFRNDFDATYPDRVRTVKDPDETVIVIGYPGSGNVGGLPNKLIFWDFELNLFGNGEIEHDALIENATENVGSLDSPGIVGDPDGTGDDPDYPDGGVDGGNVPPVPDLPSFDDRLAEVGASALGAFDTSFIASQFNGDELKAVLETGDMEFAPGGWSKITEARPRNTGRKAQISIGRNDQPGGDVNFNAPTVQNRNGWCPQRNNSGSSHRVRLHLPAGWGQASGCDLRIRRAGKK